MQTAMKPESQAARSLPDEIICAVELTIAPGHSDRFNKLREVWQGVAAQRGVELPWPDEAQGEQPRRLLIGGVPERLPKMGLCKRMVANGIGNTTYSEYELPDLYGRVRDYWNGVSVGLGFSRIEQTEKLVSGLLWAIAVNPQVCLREVDDVSGLVTAKGPGWLEVFNWMSGTGHNFGPEYIRLNWKDGWLQLDLRQEDLRLAPLTAEAGNPAGPASTEMTPYRRPLGAAAAQLLLYGRHNRLMHQPANMVGDGTGESFLVFEIVDRCGSSEGGPSIRNYAVVDAKGKLISRQSSFGRIEAYQTRQENFDEVGEAPARLPKIV